MVGKPFEKGKPRPPASGRRRGVPNKATVIKRVLDRQAKDGGLLPMDVFLATMRDQTLPLEMRLLAANMAAKFLYPTLQAVKLETDDQGSAGVIVELVQF